jgi:hypothetical protein
MRRTFVLFLVEASWHTWFSIGIHILWGPMAATRPQLCNHSDRSGRQSTHPTSRRRLHLAIRRHALFRHELSGMVTPDNNPSATSMAAGGFN